jgi:hypothetical protein
MLHLLCLYRTGYSTRTVHRSRPCISLPVDCASTGSLQKHMSISSEPSTLLAIVFAHFGWHTKQANNVSLSWRPGRIVLQLVDGTVGLSQGPLSFPVWWTQFYGFRDGNVTYSTHHFFRLGRHL